MKPIYVGMLLVGCLLVLLLFFRGYLDYDTAQQMKLQIAENTMQKIEEHVQQKGILVMNNPSGVVVEHPSLIPFQTDKECMKNIEKVVEDFSNITIAKKTDPRSKIQELLRQRLIDKHTPIVVVKESGTENPVVMMTGLAACSRLSLFSLLCNISRTKKPLCAQYEIEKYVSESEALPKNDLNSCFDCCIIETEVSDFSLWYSVCGSICGNIPSFTEGMIQSYRSCSEASCKNEKEDQGCCLKSKCVFEGKCYDQRTIRDIDNDGTKEICIETDGLTVWDDPDHAQTSCLASSLFWINKNCCGDDQEEYPLSCKGPFCVESEVNCCSTNGCVFDGQCFEQGCNVLSVAGEKKHLYCDPLTNGWVDLDTNPSLCGECLGENHWLEGSCCGDDEEREKSLATVKYVINKTQHETALSCLATNQKGCFNPSTLSTQSKGCVTLQIGQNQETFGCQQDVWQDLDTSASLCEDCGLHWVKSQKFCCGNDGEEFPVAGDDGSFACCDVPGLCVHEGACYECGTCGNNILDPQEQCERPGTKNNPLCSTEKFCQGTKTVMSNELGNCNEYCQCEEPNAFLGCVKGSCNAGCNEDESGCKNNEWCDTEQCACEPLPRRETCNDHELCRISKGCDSVAGAYDLPEYCSNNTCPLDKWSQGEEYCQNCDHCGDGIVNCGEACDDVLVPSNETYCRQGSLWREVGRCNNCKFSAMDAVYEELVDDCYCNCPSNQDQCVGGNYRIYPEDYDGSCTGSACDACSCDDFYTTDSDHDGIEDKCESEICDNGLDDNDNGKVDYEDEECITNLCESCRAGIFKFCRYDTCRSLDGQCFFEKKMLGFGNCLLCNSSSCDIYQSNKFACEQDDCKIGKCFWNGNLCCEDVDQDAVCDDRDNCKNLNNPGQEDSDGDGLGNLCDADDNNDGCADGYSGSDDFTISLGKNKTCADKCSFCQKGNCILRAMNDNHELGPCSMCDGNSSKEMLQTSEEGSLCSGQCTQCKKGVCEVRGRCDRSECPSSLYCDGLSDTCKSPVDTPRICESCVPDQTTEDQGIAWLNGCCGDQPEEYFFTNANQCCSSSTDCIDNQGNCRSTGTRQNNNQVICLNQSWQSCGIFSVNQTIASWSCEKKLNRFQWLMSVEK